MFQRGPGPRMITWRRPRPSFTGGEGGHGDLRLVESNRRYISYLVCVCVCVCVLSCFYDTIRYHNIAQHSVSSYLSHLVHSPFRKKQDKPTAALCVCVKFAQTREHKTKTKQNNAVVVDETCPNVCNEYWTRRRR